MSKKYKSGDIYLERMIIACEKILEYVKDVDELEFFKKEKIFDAVCMQFTHLGEQATQLQESPDRVIQHFPDEVDWAGLRQKRYGL